MNNKILNSNKDKIFFCLMVIFALVSTLKMLSFSLSGGILNPDICLYSITALKYAGIDYYNICNPSEIFFTPIISFLTSILFRFGLVDKSAIIIVTAFFCFLSYVGLYCLLKIRFNSLLSLIGVIIYGSTSVVIFNLSKGMIDIPALSISIWAIFFAIKSINENPKYFLITFPLLVIGFFVKYVVGFVVPAIFVYYLMNRNIINLFDLLISDRILFKQKLKKYISSDEFKYIFISVVISAILLVIICKTLILDFGGSLTFFDQSANTFNGKVKVTSQRIFNPDKSYYIDNFSKMLFQAREFRSFLSGLLYFIFGAGVIIELINIIKNRDFLKLKKESFTNAKLEKILIILSICLILLSFYGFKVLENHMLSNISLIFSVILIYSILIKYPLNKEKLTLNLLFLTYFMVNLIFISIYPDKTLRYALPLLPSVIYAIVWALDIIFNFLTKGFDDNQTFVREIRNKMDYSNLSKAIAIILILIFVVSTLSFILPMEFDRSNKVYSEVLYCGFSNDLDDACDFIVNSDSDYHSKTFASFTHSSRIIRWNMNVNVTVLDIDNPNLSFNDTDYLILFKDLDFDNYHKIKECGDFYIYHRNK